MNEGYEEITQSTTEPVMREITLTNIMIAVVIIIYVVTEFKGDTGDAEFMYKCGALWTPDVIENGQYYRLLSAVFLHFGAEHLFGNVLLWYFMGNILERAMGKIRYFILFMLTGICGNAATILWEMHTGDFAVSAGASGAIFGILGALLLIVICHKGHYEYMSLKRLLFFVGLSLAIGYETAGVNYVAHAAGLVSGFLLAAIIYIPLKRYSSLAFGGRKNYTKES